MRLRTVKNDIPAGRPAYLLRRIGTVAIATAGLAVGAAPAQQSPATDRISALEQKLERSVQLIEALSEKLRKIEAGTAGRDETTRQQARIESLEQQVSQVADSVTRRGTEEGLVLRGFADAGLNSSSKAGGVAKGASLGNLSLYLTPQFGERTKGLIELNFEFDRNGNLATDLERLQLGYTFNDQATLWLGRFHTPYGYWNTAFHHGQQLQTSVRRPRFLDFEDKGGILPAHTVGAWLTGGMRAGDGKLTWDVYGGNSPRIADNTLNMNNAGSTNHNWTAGANLGYAFGGRLEGLKAGGFFQRARVDDDAAVVNTTRLNFHGAYAVYDTKRWEHIIELYRFNNSDLTGASGTHRSAAGVAQFGYRSARWTTYGRFERAALDQNDNYFAQQASGLSYTRHAFGLRFDLDAKSALKLELARTRNTDRDPAQLSEALLQYAVRF